MVIYSEPVFEPGARVVAVASHGWRITGGKEYEVVRYLPAFMEGSFRVPAYVVVLDDFGKECTCHTHRFRSKETV